MDSVKGVREYVKDESIQDAVTHTLKDAVTHTLKDSLKDVVTHSLRDPIKDTVTHYTEVQTADESGKQFVIC